jgi:hypothetical protein
LPCLNCCSTIVSHIISKLMFQLTHKLHQILILYLQHANSFVLLQDSSNFVALKYNRKFVNQPLFLLRRSFLCLLYITLPHSQLLLFFLFVDNICRVTQCLSKSCFINFRSSSLNYCFSWFNIGLLSCTHSIICS